MTLQGLLAVLTLGCLGVELPSLVRRAPALRGVLWPGVLALVFAFGALLVWGPGSVPDAMLVPLREGREFTLHDVIIARHPFLPARLYPALAPLRVVVWVHLGEAVLALVLLAGWARVRGGAFAALGLPLLLCGSPWFVQGVLSDGHMVTVLWVWLAGAALAATADDHGRLGPVAVVGLLAATVLSGADRPEVLAVTLPVLATVLGRPWLLGVERWVLARDPLGVFVATVLASSVGLYLLVLLGPLLPSPPTFYLGQGMIWSRLHLGNLRLPVDLLGFLPMGLVALVAVGVWRAPEAGLRALVVWMSMLFLARLYAVASHVGGAPYETLRYHAMLLGPLLWLALEGADVVRRLPWRGVGVLWAALAVTVVLPRPGSPAAVRGPAWRPVEASQQVAARFVVRAREDHPSCLILSRFAMSITRELGDPVTWEYGWSDAAYGGPLNWSNPVLDAETLADRLEAIGLDRAWAPASTMQDVAKVGAPCVLFLSGIDCTLPGSGCVEAVQGTATIRELTADVPAFNTHHGSAPGPLHFSLHLLWGELPSTP